MRTERIRFARVRPLAVTAAIAAVLLGAAPTAVAARQQGEGPSLLLVDAETRVASVDFRFPGGADLERDQLRSATATAGPGPLRGVRDALDFVPGISPLTPQRFSPLVLQRDVVRLRRLYRRSGFPEVAVDYDVVLDTTRNEVDVTFVIEQGPPILVDSVRVRLAAAGEASGDGGGEPQAPAIPEEHREAWARLLDRLGRARGERFGELERVRLENVTTRWFLERGYPWAWTTVSRADSADHRVDVELTATPGPRARVDSIVIEGASRLSDRVLRRELALRPGDWYHAGRLTAGERELYELDLVRRALGGVPEEQPRDSTVTVRYRLAEGRPRLIWGRTGWRSESGFAGEVHWSHRNFFGGARTFTASALSETGWGAVEQARGRSVGLSVIARQPWVGHRYVSASLGPFVRWRDDFRDQSLLFGVESSLMWRARPLRTVTIQHELSRMRVDEAFQLGPVREIVERGDSVFEPVFVRNVFKASGSYGTLDDRLDPRSGYLVEPNLSVAGPAGATDVEYVRLAVQGMVAVPLSRRVGVFLRASAGRLFPSGESDPAEGTSRTRALVGLRGVLFTAGGTGDVRGWGPGHLGSKIPEITLDGSGAVSSDRFVPAGGLARLSGSVELMLPFPLLPEPHGTHLFFDAGRVWSPGSRFDPRDPELVLEEWGYAVGGGIQLGTLVGPVRLSVGYKLNPTRVDLLSPGQVAGDLATGGDLSGLGTDSFRRWHLHLSIGRSM